MTRYKDDKVFKKLVEIVNNLTTYFTKSRKHSSHLIKEGRRTKFNNGSHKKETPKWKKYLRGRCHKRTDFDTVRKRRDKRLYCKNYHKESRRDQRRGKSHRGESHRGKSRRREYNHPSPINYKRDDDCFSTY